MGIGGWVLAAVLTEMVDWKWYMHIAIFRRRVFQQLISLLYKLLLTMESKWIEHRSN